MSDKELRLGFEGSERKEKVTWADNQPEPWGLGNELDVVGKSHVRKDAFDKVTGRAKYSYDIRFDDLIYAKILRSPHACARVVSVDLEKAKKLPGVLYTETFGPSVRYAGAAVAGVAAASEEVLDDALALIKVEYEVLPSVVSVDEARKEGAPRVFPNRGNVTLPGRGGRQGDPDRVAAAHKEADVTVEAEYRTQVQTHSCLETHGCVCKWEGDKLTVWSSTQGTFSVRGAMARALNVPPGNITVITEHMGGGFGSKFGADQWDVFAAQAAKATGRPCRAMLDRREEHLVAGNRPDSIQRCRFSAKKDGTLCGAEVRSWGTGGVGGGAGVFNPGNIYKWKATFSEQHNVSTHAARGRAFRAPRHPQGIFALEGMLDEVAEKLGMDPLELRRKNDADPVRLAQYEVGAAAIGWSNRKPTGSQKGRLRRGFGLASSRWGHNARPGTVVNCRVGKDGSVLMSNGSQDIGTGTRTTIAIMAAEELGLTPERIDVRLGNTNDPYGHGSGGSVTTPSISVPARVAAFEAKRQVLEAVAKKIGGDAAAMDLENGKVTGAPRALDFEQACGLLDVDAVETTGRGTREWWGKPRYTSQVAGVQFAEVEVDVETGRVRVVKVVAVQDCGRVVNDLTTRSQINGGVIQGLAYALMEERLLDPNTGNMVNADFLNYRIPGALDMPEIVAVPFTVSQGGTITGVSSLGEPATVPTAGAIGNAVANALGARVRSLPITPAKVLAAAGGAS
jgi:xanthine dehydrogenase YagR molybdenum-binding subunit